MNVNDTYHMKLLYMRTPIYCNYQATYALPVRMKYKRCLDVLHMQVEMGLIACASAKNLSCHMAQGGVGAD